MSDKYILKGKRVFPCDNLIVWAKWIENNSNKRRVALTKIGDAEISTVFLGLDHSFGVGPRLLFETMVFGGELAEETNRYSTWREAEQGHKAICQKVRERIEGDKNPDTHKARDVPNP